MQIPSLSSPAQSILSNSAQNIDGSRQVPGSAGGASKPEDSSQLSGRDSSSQAVQSSADSVKEVAAPKQAVAVQTQVITTADETMGTSLGLNVDIMV
ncbi:MAG: hypothetical protein V7707_17115 [Motiliproteus sp.]